MSHFVDIEIQAYLKTRKPISLLKAARASLRDVGRVSRQFLIPNQAVDIYINERVTQLEVPMRTMRTPGE